MLKFAGGPVQVFMRKGGGGHQTRGKLEWNGTQNATAGSGKPAVPEILKKLAERVCVCGPGVWSIYCQKYTGGVQLTMNVPTGLSRVGVFHPVLLGFVTTLQWGDGFGILVVLSPRVDLCRDPRAYLLLLELLSQIAVEKAFPG